MRNYIEINGVSSLTLVGFAINTLPPISKPPIRNLKEEIDGRDGDIITKLGYGAYDKEIEVGLYGESYDINDIIAFFNTEGEVVFSNEPDKIYNFTILDQIDFEKLVKFKTAVITLHCQPFKYKKNEEPIEIEYQYVEGEGTAITLNNTDDQPLEMEMFGNGSQTQTTQSKNLFDKTRIIEGKYIDNNGNIVTDPDNFIGDYIYISTSNNYYVSSSSTQPKRIAYYNSSKTFISRQLISATGGALVIPNNSTYVRLSGYNVDLSSLQLEIGSSATSYVPFVPNSPTPDYPQDIHVVSGDNNIVICGKNLFTLGYREANTVSGATSVLNGSEFSLNGTYSATGNPIRDSENYQVLYIGFFKAGTYHITSSVKEGSFTPPSGGAYNTYIRNAKNGSSSSQILQGGFNTSQTFTLTNDTPLYYHIYTNKEGYIFNNLVVNIQIEKGSTSTIYEPYQGNTYNIDLPVENLCNNDNVLGLFLNYTNSTIGEADGSKTMYAKVPKNTELTVSRVTLTNRFRIGLLNEIPQNGGTFYLAYNGDSSSDLSKTINSGNYEYVAVQYTNQGEDANIQIEQGSKANTYTPFGTTPIELCKIPNTDYIDGFEYNIDEGKWYKNKVINKKVLDGTEAWGVHGAIASWFYWDGITDGIVRGGYNDFALSNYFRQKPYNYVTTLTNGEFAYGEVGGETTKRLVFKDTDFTTVGDFESWLEAHNTDLYYVLATPVKEEITDTTLKGQLDAILEAVARKGQTNIIQVNNDLPFYIKATTREQGSDTATITNEGNIYSKPILELSGEGTIGVSLNGNQLFNVDLSDPNAIVIDPNQLEAYNPDTLNLMNRKVEGDIENLRLPIGENTLKVSGNLTKATITNYERWL